MIVSAFILFLSFVTLLVILFLSIFLKKWKAEGRRRPGPWGFPIVGHLPLLGQNPAKTLMKWKKIYGPIFFIRFGSVETVVINDSKLIKETLSLNEASGRLRVHYADVVTGRKGLVLTEGPKAFEQRAFFLKTIKEFGYGKGAMEARIQDEISQLLEQFTKKFATTRAPFVSKNIFSLSVINALWDVMIGSRFDTHSDNPQANKLLRQLDTIKKTDTLFAKLAQFLPWLGRLMSFFGCNGNEIALRGLFDHVGREIEQRRKSWTTGHPRHFTDAFFDKVASTTTGRDSAFHPDNKSQVFVTGDIFLAGTETTSSSLEWLLLYMAANIPVQRRMQAEIDHVIGGPGTRAPSIADRPECPYSEAVVHELLRITALIPFAIPHSALNDFVLGGFTIKKGTMVLPNLYGAHHDPSLWPQPAKFNPHRFIDSETGKFRKAEANFFPFSTGRRYCIGDNLAKDQLFLYCTSIFQKFNIQPARQGAEPNFEPIFGFALTPRPFEMILEERLLC